MNADVSVDWLLWVRRLGGAKVAFDANHPNHGAMIGLVGPLAFSDDDMPAYLEQLTEIYGALS